LTGLTPQYALIFRAWAAIATFLTQSTEGGSSPAIMTALAAIYSYSENTSDIRGDLGRMLRALKVHGPDREGLAAGSRMGLGAALSIGFTPEDQFERQPVTQGPFQIVFHGFLANRNDVIAKLGLEHSSANLSDSALVARAWAKWDEDTLSHLYGTYAIAVADEQNKKLTIARSPYRAPPVNYYEADGRVVIATVPKGIFALDSIPRELDIERLADNVILNHRQRHRSYFKGVQRLPLGCTMVIDPDGISVRGNYDLNDHIRPVRFKHDQDYLDAANELLTKLVTEYSRARETPGISLSSGFDSTAVAVPLLEQFRAAGKRGALPPAGYTSVPEEGWDGRVFGEERVGDESGPVRAMAKMYPELQVNFIDSAGAAVTEYLDQLFFLGEVPPRNIGNMHWMVDVAKAARRDGRRVLLNGMGGNMTLSNDNRDLLPQMFRQGRWIELYRQMRQINPRWWTGHGFFGNAIFPQLPAKTRHKLRLFFARRKGKGWRRASAMRPEFMEEFQAGERRMVDDPYQSVMEHGQFHGLYLSSGTRDEGSSVMYAIETLTGVEQRDPLGDLRMHEFCAGLPGEQFLWNGTRRRLIKRMMAERLPEEILTAPKGRQGADWHLRMTRNLDEHRRDVQAMADDEELSPILDVERMQRLIDDWPEQTPISSEDHPDHLLAHTGLPRAIAASRFADWVRGTNR